MAFEKYMSKIGKMNETTNVEEVITLYDDWAETYDQDVYGGVDRRTNKIPMILSETLKAHGIGTEARLLDAGCGTGLIGACLKDEYGFQNIEGFDASAASVEKARQTGAYVHLSTAVMGVAQHTLPCKHYDALFCNGCFGFGHFPAAAMDEFISLVKKDGIVCIAIRKHIAETTDEGRGFLQKMDSLEEKHAWKLLKTDRFVRYTGVEFFLFTFQVII